MSSLEENHVIDWLPDFVLGALTGDELRQVNEHLAHCSSCQAELSQLQQVAADLPLALPQTDPPPQVKRRLMQSIHTRKANQIFPSNKPSFLQYPADFFRAHLPAFGVALMVILALGNLLLWRQLNLATQTKGTSLRVVTLSNTQFSPGAIGTLVMSPDSQNSTLVVYNLSALTPDKQYQVWLIKGVEHISAGVFTVDPSGYASLDIIAPEPYLQFDAIGISIEPTGGSLEPTGSSVLHAFLSR
jgi:anti-sigma-K factor RskA